MVIAIRATKKTDIYAAIFSGFSAFETVAFPIATVKPQPRPVIALRTISVLQVKSVVMIS